MMLATDFIQGVTESAEKVLVSIQDFAIERKLNDRLRLGGE
jgi:hypothetical protein